MNQYSSYKDSGVEWIGEIPSHWKKGKLKHYFDLSSGKNPSDYDKSDGEYPVYGSNGVIGYTNTPNLFNKTILIGRVGSSGELNYNLFPCSVSDNCLIVELYGTNDLSFVYYLLKNTGLKNYTTKTSQPLITGSTIKEIETILPPLSEQHQIVSYLDNKTSSIDSLIQSKEKKIELLKEKRTSLINQVVTKGLNPDVEMKDSGVEWIGEIPSHWIKTKVKYISDVVRGSILRPVDEPLYFDENGEWTYLNISDVSKVEKFLNYGKLRLSELGSTKSRRVEPNNLIITGSGTVGKVFINTIPVCVHDGFIPILDLKVNINFMFYYLINPNLYVGIGKTNSQKNIYLDEVKEMDISIPTDTEQQQIVEYLDEQTQLIDNTISIEEKRIELLKEYRQSLISEVVTGKRKVTTDE